MILHIINQYSRCIDIADGRIRCNTDIGKFSAICRKEITGKRCDYGNQ